MLNFRVSTDQALDPKSGPQYTMQHEPHKTAHRADPSRIQQGPLARVLRKALTSTAQLPFKTPLIPSSRDHEALNGCTLGVLAESKKPYTSARIRPHGRWETAPCTSGRRKGAWDVFGAVFSHRVDRSPPFRRPSRP